jgi:hypothetical protein
MNTISKVEMVKLLEGVKGTTFVGVDYCAPVEMRKTGNPYVGHDVTKTTSLTGQFGGDYENWVNNQREREGKSADFDAASRTWGENLGKGIILNPKTGEVSIQLIMTNAPSDTVYRIDGEQVDKTVLEPFLPVKKVNKENQGTDKTVVVRTLRTDRIKVLRVNGEAYVIV